MEHNSVLHNMSAPPKSRLVIAPHRRSKVLLTFQLPPLTTQGWREELLALCRLDDWETLKGKSDRQMMSFETPAAMSIIGVPADIVDDPLLTIAILSRCIGNLFLLRRQKDLSLERLSQSVTISDKGFIQKLVGLGEQ